MPLPPVATPHTAFRQTPARLQAPELDVTKVAFPLGYEDSSSFYLAFRSREGTIPAQFKGCAATICSRATRSWVEINPAAACLLQVGLNHVRADRDAISAIGRRTL